MTAVCCRSQIHKAAFLNYSIPSDARVVLTANALEAVCTLATGSGNIYYITIRSAAVA